MATASGRRLRRDDYVEHGTGPHGLRFQSQEIDGFEVADFGDTAIATMILHDRFEVDGHAISETYRSFCVFRRHGTRWLWAGGQTCVAGKWPVKRARFTRRARKTTMTSACPRP